MLIIPIAAFTKYWPILLVSLIDPSIHYFNSIRQKKYKDAHELTELVYSPYRFVFKSQALMLIAMVLTYFSNDFLTYWALILFYFFPWLESWHWFKSRNEE